MGQQCQRALHRRHLFSPVHSRTAAVEFSHRIRTLSTCHSGLYTSCRGYPSFFFFLRSPVAINPVFSLKCAFFGRFECPLYLVRIRFCCKLVYLWCTCVPSRLGVATSFLEKAPTYFFFLRLLSPFSENGHVSPGHPPHPPDQPDQFD